MGGFVSNRIDSRQTEAQMPTIYEEVTAPRDLLSKPKLECVMGWQCTQCLDFTPHLTARRELHVPLDSLVIMVVHSDQVLLLYCFLTVITGNRCPACRLWFRITSGVLYNLLMDKVRVRFCPWKVYCEFFEKHLVFGNVISYYCNRQLAGPNSSQGTGFLQVLATWAADLNPSSDLRLGRRAASVGISGLLKLPFGTLLTISEANYRVPLQHLLGLNNTRKSLMVRKSQRRHTFTLVLIILRQLQKPVCRSPLFHPGWLKNSATPRRAGSLCGLVRNAGCGQWAPPLPLSPGSGALGLKLNKGFSDVLEPKVFEPVSQSHFLLSTG